MSIDCEKLQLFIFYFHWSWHGPLLALIVMGILIGEIGYASSLIGMAFLLCAIPLQDIIANQLGVIRRKMIHFTDERLKLINELLQSIRIIKLYAWESPIEERIERIRKDETTLLRQYLDRTGYLREMFFASQPIIGMLMLTVSIYLFDHPFTVVQTFRVLSFLNMTRTPFNLIGQALKNDKDGFVSLHRLNEFFLLPVVHQSVNNRKAVDNPRIIIEQGSFCWQDKTLEDSNNLVTTNKDKVDSADIELQTVPINEATYFKLKDISFRNRCNNELIAVIGSVGSGKSSFLSALLQEMTQLSGTCDIAGSISYCSQVPWIQNLSLQQNILFEHNQLSSLSNEFYKKAIQAAALLPDIAILPAGDETESK